MGHLRSTGPDGYGPAVTQLEDLFVTVANAIGHELFHDRADGDGIVELTEEEAAVIERVARRVLTDVMALLGS